MTNGIAGASASLHTHHKIMGEGLRCTTEIRVARTGAAVEMGEGSKAAASTQAQTTKGERDDEVGWGYAGQSIGLGCEGAKKVGLIHTLG